MIGTTGKSKISGKMLTIAALFIIIAGLNMAAAYVVPFILAVFIAMLCAPALFWLKRRGVPRPLAILVVMIATMLIGFVIVAIIGTSLNDFSKSLPLYQERINDKMMLILLWLEEFGIETFDDQGLGDMVDMLDAGAAMQLVSGMLAGLKKVLTNAFLILLTVIFILLEASSFPKKLRAVLKNPEGAMKHFDRFNHDLQRYIVIKTITSLVTGVVIWIWLTILGVDNPLLWGFLAFLLNYIPTIGSIFAGFPPSILAFVQLGTGHMVLVIIGFVVVNTVIGSFMEPRVMGRGLGLSTLVVFLSLVFWGYVFGPVGMLLAVPLTMTAKIALATSDETRWVSVLLGSEKSEELRT
ncbi:MAG: AI-2E family transporter [Thermodesulfobacteriota bacterium]